MATAPSRATDAEELPEFNRHISAPIRVISAFFGDGFTGLVPEIGGMAGKTAREQLKVLAGHFVSSPQGLHGEVSLNSEATYLHWPYWWSLELSAPELAAPKTDVLRALEATWHSLFPTIPLPQTTNFAER